MIGKQNIVCHDATCNNAYRIKNADDVIASSDESRTLYACQRQFTKM